MRGLVRLMADYKKMYYELAGSVADAIEILVKAMQQGEETYISAVDAPIVLLTPEKNPDEVTNQ